MFVFCFPTSQPGLEDAGCFATWPNFSCIWSVNSRCERRDVSCLGWFVSIHLQINRADHWVFFCLSPSPAPLSPAGVPSVVHSITYYHIHTDIKRTDVSKHICIAQTFSHHQQTPRRFLWPGWCLECIDLSFARLGGVSPAGAFFLARHARQILQGVVASLRVTGVWLHIPVSCVFFFMETCELYKSQDDRWFRWLPV